MQQCDFYTLISDELAEIVGAFNSTQNKIRGVGIAQFNLATADGNTPEVRPLAAYDYRVI